ncbi:hypothetical protein AYI69_g4511 [Smittium culicis]|uniref:Retrotransposon gag domain-containing protein n=1 Tax=Smittium culicis TaxID=133412 RepID=A0A1R1YD34_9FUNG|nr:hypothetical protein AYI69_g4511 [Smittium culicis]
MDDYIFKGLPDIYKGDGTDYLSPFLWIESFEEISQKNKWSNGIRLSVFKLWIENDVTKWLERLPDINNWDSLKKSFIEEYSDAKYNMYDFLEYFEEIRYYCGESLYDYNDYFKECINTIFPSAMDDNKIICFYLSRFDLDLKKIGFRNEYSYIKLTLNEVMLRVLDKFENRFTPEAIHGNYVNDHEYPKNYIKSTEKTYNSHDILLETLKEISCSLQIKE